MSEVDQIITSFRAGRANERTASGIDPVICVAGHDSYFSLMGVCEILYSSVTKEQQKSSQVVGWLEFEGVNVYLSRSIKNGFYFGHIEKSP